MLTFLKRIFRQKRRLDPAGRIAPRVVPESAPAMARVETASLQLTAILARFPEELKALILKQPSPDAMVKLPVPTIVKFLPSGSVKMSLASVVRQSPAGTFSPITTQDKRLVEVPLAEIFKRVTPAILKKRENQRYAELAEGGVDIFGDDENPHALAPREIESPAEVPQPAAGVLPAFELRTLASPETPSRLAMQPGTVPPKPASPLGGADSLRMTDAPIFARLAKVPPPMGAPARPASASRTSPPVETGPLVLSLQELVDSWPEPIKSEAIALNGATVALPSSEVSAGLAKGKVAFQWGQIRAWLTPPPSAPTEASEDVELPLPLRVVAPAFLKLSTNAATKARKPLPEQSIPSLFTGRSAPEKVEMPIEPAIELTVEPAIEPTVQPSIETGSPVAEEQPPVFESKIDAPVAPTTENVFRFADEERARGQEPAVANEAPAPIFAEEVQPGEKSVAAAAQTVGEFLGQAEKTNWSPEELVAALMQRPEIDGAVVALQEGLVVAHQFPEGMKGDVFAAFLPQVFARLNLYSSEMMLGSVDDLVITAAGGQCQLFRIGQIYFAVLAKLGAILPSRELRLCAGTLAAS